MTELKQMLTTEEVAKILNVSRMTVIRMIEAGELQAIKLGRVYRVDPDQFNEFLAKAKVQVKEKV